MNEKIKNNLIFWAAVTLGVGCMLFLGLMKGGFVHADDTSSTTDTTASTTLESGTSTALGADATTTPMEDDSDDPNTSTSTPPVIAPDDTTSTASDTTAVFPAAATILTGNAGAVANVTNVVNTNITDSQGLIAFLNLFGPYLGNVDLSNLDFQTSTCGSSCSTQTLQSSANTTDVNSSTIVNNVTVTADTGGNSVTGEGSSTVVTGNAAAAANVVNVANTNISDSNYLLFVLNDFSELDGDVILPDGSFFTQFLNATGTSAGSANITNDNSSAITNDVSASALTGDNTASTTGTNTITTGQATAVSNVLNVANQNITQNNQVVLLVHVLGSWNGQIFDAPPGVQWQQTQDGLILTGSGVENLFGGGGNITNQNSATIQNNVQAYALTGNNEIAGSGGADIGTGDAAAAANVVNIANTNVVGKNILFGLINILGNWQGNLAFGQPDLWVGTQAKVSDTPLLPGSSINYTVTLTNRGNATATNVVLSASDANPGVAYVSDPGSGTEADGGLAWNIPSVAPGQTLQFTYSEAIQSSLGFIGPGNLTENINATENEDDANPADNNDSISFAVEGPGSYPNVSHLILKESNSAQSSTFTPGNLVTYQFLLNDRDSAGPAQDVVLNESLYDPYGNMVTSSTWPIGTVEPGDEFLVSYQTLFPTSTPEGWYASYSSVSGLDSSGQLWQTADTISSSSVYVVVPGEDSAPPPTSAPKVVYVPPPAPSTPTTHPTIGKNVENPKIEKLTPTSTPPSASSGTASGSVAEALRAGLTASIATVFGAYPGKLFQAFLGILHL